MTLRLPVVGSLLALAGTAFAAPPGPRIACPQPGTCFASQLPPVVSDPEVAGFLKSGLTTSLVLTLSTRGERGLRTTAAARIEVRFEPWEEVFHTRVLPSSAGPLRLASPAALESWWRELRVAFPVSATPRGPARLELSVVPFSEEEEADTRRWYAETLRRPGAPAREGSAAAATPALADMLDALTLTSIKRRGVRRFSWSAPVERSP